MQESTFHRGFGGCCRRLPGMVGLNRASGHQHVSAGFNGISDQKLEFAGLVAATFEAGQVISLDPQLLAVQLSTEIFQPVNRRWQLRQRSPWPSGQFKQQFVDIIFSGHRLLQTGRIQTLEQFSLQHNWPGAECVEQHIDDAA